MIPSVAMESRLVLVIEDDDHIANQLAVAIREADYEVILSSTAGAGLAAAIETRPDCVVCDVDLPDEDGYSVTRDLRAHPSPASATPLVLLSVHGDPQARMDGFHAGADGIITKPFRAEEVVAQIDALVQLATRLRRRREAMLSVPPEMQYGSAAIEGDVRQMSIGTMLSVLGMERRTGVFEVVSKKRRAQVEIVSGYVVQGTVGGTRVPPLQALRLMISWKVGRFSFIPLPPYDPPPSLRTVQAMLLDAAKAEDEAAAGMPSSATFDGHLATSFGGPPSRPGDTAPPSSRAMREAAGAPVSLAFDLISSRRVEDRHGVASIDLAWGPAASAPGRPPHAAAPPPSKGGHAPKGPHDVNLSISIDLDELSMEEVISVKLDELEPVSAGADHTQESPIAQLVTPDHRSTPTPPSGTPAVGLLRTPAIRPPPSEASERVKMLPAPPAPPRPSSRTTRSPQRAPPKKG
jgi:two-component system OmpR family response regulator